ncbi:hypothetical protein BIY37_02585 [Candidatus Brocadia sapporoensis]|uniref:Type III pantothenate kinase n=1 Tax=Candidatus Brocadia sapporoensis TaxID=392547 RepID=A0A1V6M2G0_9BACT|nr:type III pantothenate kinase [Candidatus Brocadia sapporoensis]MDG6005219.1 type III pantothenate kinase [Candidatus Brocadia sp.]OQD46601.1 hypothetical protein BIY37_02585 [Candidatus Brocadia sapporoensis]GJQ24176.1 MAG: type III pantothenate kinase [Candidatus Brocadia sapporoensis]
MQLAIDIGNTNIHIGIFEEDILRSTHTVGSGSLHQTNFTKILTPAIFFKTQAVILASVNPQAEACVIEYLGKHSPVQPCRIGKEIPIPMPILTESPEMVGIDRLVNAIAAFERTKNPAIVVDAGTAITIDGINEKGAFLGGIIAPGIGMSLKALHHATALLPLVSISKPKNVFGKNTEEAIRSGIFWGTVGMIHQVIDMMSNEMKCQPPVIVTGGDASVLAPELPVATTVLPYLTLEGIHLAYKINIASLLPY